jgi:thymidylate kinase
LFVALEGIDGAGKTTTARTAAAVLRSEGHAAVALDRASLAGVSGYVAGHMARLRELIWGERPDAPYLELGDEHWVLLQAAWYSALSWCVVTPLLEAGNAVIADTWGQKFLAKLQLRPPGVIDVAWARAVFTAFREPDLIVHVRADPGNAAARKQGVSGSETGSGDGAPQLSQASFEAYQRQVRQVLDGFARQGGWVDLDVAALSPGEAGKALADLIRHRLEATPCLAVPAGGRAWHDLQHREGVLLRGVPSPGSPAAGSQVHPPARSHLYRPGAAGERGTGPGGVRD